MTDRRTTGFGCPNTTDPHYFAVEIPAGRSGFVSIVEQYGVRAGIGGLPETAERCRLPRHIWGAIAEELKRDFNERLAAKKLPTSRWIVGVNKVERLLGKELLILAWAVERADPALIPNALRNWIGLKPEERWWLYTMTAAASGSADDSDVGWRKALRFALTENPADEEQLSARKTRARGLAEDPSPFEAPILPLFDRVTGQ